MLLKYQSTIPQVRFFLHVKKMHVEDHIIRYTAYATLMYLWDMSSKDLIHSYVSSKN